MVDVSPVKVAKSGKQYFRLEIQTAKKVDDALCFSPSKRRLFDELCVQRSGCVINNVKKGKDTLYVNDYSTVEKKELGFSQNPAVEYMRIEQVINQVALDSKVNVKGLVILDDVRIVRVHGEDVNIREGHLVDETSRIKITLWREYCDLENNTTYNLRNVAKMKYSGEIQLQTLHNTTFSLSSEQIEEYEEIPIVEDVNLSNVSIGSIEASPPYCPECSKPVVHPNKDDLLVTCSNCSKVMLFSNLKRKKSHFIIVGNGLEKRKMSVHEDLLQVCFPEKDVQEMHESQVMILLLTNKFNISYKDTSMHVTGLELAV